MSADALPSLSERVSEEVRLALATVGMPDLDPIVRPSARADFQSNAALAYAKRSGLSSLQLAERLAGEIHAPATPEISERGFLNLHLSAATVWEQAALRLDAGDRMGIGTPLGGQRVVIDYSSPNIAKEMHVGHLRSTILGDALARTFGHLGADVIRQNHLGDWGTQFGMLIQYLDDHPEARWRQAEVGSGTSAISALDGLYRAAQAEFTRTEPDVENTFRDKARRRVVALQSGDAETTALWRELVAESRTAFQQVYRRLNVLLTVKDDDPESFYNPRLEQVTAELLEAGLITEADGALGVFPDDEARQRDDSQPLLVRKRDGGFGYAATDLATVRYRVEALKADRILYVVGAPQAAHFRMVFHLARQAGWLPDHVQAVHVPFGTVLGADGKPFRTRTGGAVKLEHLLDAAVDSARKALGERMTDTDEATLTQRAEPIGMAAVKYAELSTTRTKDYVFDPDSMTATQGDTGVYLQYAHARACRILDGLGATSKDSAAAIDTKAPLHPAERNLILAVDGLGDAIVRVTASLEPQELASHMHAIARSFASFYEDCPVATATGPTQSNRVALVDLTARSLRAGLDLLGIEAPRSIGARPERRPEQQRRLAPTMTSLDAPRAPRRAGGPATPRKPGPRV